MSDLYSTTGDQTFSSIQIPTPFMLHPISASVAEKI